MNSLCSLGSKVNQRVQRWNKKTDFFQISDKILKERGPNVKINTTEDLLGDLSKPDTSPLARVSRV